MGPEEKNLGDFTIYIDGQPIGGIKSSIDAAEIPTLEGEYTIFDKNTGNTIAILQSTEGTLELHFTTIMWRCRSRKRFIKLMAGAFEIQRNDAQRLADECMEAGCPSYSELWVSCYAFFIKSALNYICSKNNEERPEDSDGTR